MPAGRGACIDLTRHKRTRGGARRLPIRSGTEPAKSRIGENGASWTVSTPASRHRRRAERTADVGAEDRLRPPQPEGMPVIAFWAVADDFASRERIPAVGAQFCQGMPFRRSRRLRPPVWGRSGERNASPRRKQAVRARRQSPRRVFRPDPSDMLGPCRAQRA
jgi:hypothetical protein